MTYLFVSVALIVLVLYLKKIILSKFYIVLSCLIKQCSLFKKKKKNLHAIVKLVTSSSDPASCVDHLETETAQAEPSVSTAHTDPRSVGFRRKRNVLFNDALNTFYLRLYGIRHMVKDHSDSEKGNLLPPHRLLFHVSRLPLS